MRIVFERRTINKVSKFYNKSTIPELRFYSLILSSSILHFGSQLLINPTPNETKIPLTHLKPNKWGTQNENVT